MFSYYMEIDTRKKILLYESYLFSSTNPFNLDLSKLLSFGKEIRTMYMDRIMPILFSELVCSQQQCELCCRFHV